MDCGTPHAAADYWLGWWVIIGTIPICVLGLLFKDQIRSGVRNLWIIAIALIVLRGDRRRRVLRQADPPRRAVDLKTASSSVWRSVWCWCQVSRSGATISAGLFLGQIETAARFGFLLAIPPCWRPASSRSRRLQAGDRGMSASGQLIVAIVIAFVVGFAAVAWFLEVPGPARHVLVRRLRVILGVVVLILLGSGVMAADSHQARP